MTLPNQRDKFEIPDEIAYFNCAYTAPLLKSAAEAGRNAIQEKSGPWTLTSAHFFERLERAKKLFGALVNTDPENVAIIPSVSYGTALAANILPVEKDQKLIILEEQFPSNVYPWRKVCRQQDVKLVTIPRPGDGNWTEDVLAAIDKDTAVAALPHCHWTDGTIVDLVRVGERCREMGAALVVDGTQSLGAMPFDVRAIQPDFLVTTAHKWLMGPYSYGFCYIAPKWQTAMPLEENWLNRKGAEDFSRLVDFRDSYQPGARRFDVGEASNFILAPMASAALSQILEWGVGNISETLRGTSRSISQQCRCLGFTSTASEFRAPHMLGITHSKGFPDNLVTRLAKENIYVSVRGTSVRIAPHLYNTDEDITRLINVLATVK